MANEVRLTLTQLNELQKLSKELGISFTDITKGFKTITKELEKNRDTEQKAYKELVESMNDLKRAGRELSDSQKKDLDQAKLRVEKWENKLQRLQLEAGDRFITNLEKKVLGFVGFSQKLAQTFTKRELKWTTNWYEKRWGRTLIKVGDNWNKFLNSKYFQTVKTSYEKITGHIRSMWDEVMGPLGRYVDMAAQGLKIIATSSWQLAKFFGKAVGFGVGKVVPRRELVMQADATADVFGRRFPILSAPLDFLMGVQQGMLDELKNISSNTEETADVQKKTFAQTLRDKLRAIRGKAGGIFGSLGDMFKGLLGGAGSLLGGLLGGAGKGLLAALGGVGRFLGRLIKFAPRLLKFLGPLAAGLTLAWSAFKGWDEKEAERLFGDGGFLAKLGSSVSHVISTITFGTLSPDDIANGIKKVGEWFSTAADWVGNVLDKIGVKWRETKKFAAEKYEAGKEATKSAVNKASEWLGLGSVFAKKESGKAGYAAVSTGKGDPGGASYGKYQFSSKKGTLQEFLKNSGYDAMFSNMAPGSKEFNEKWKNLGKYDKAFGEAQEKYAKEKFYDPIASEAERMGLDLKQKAIQEALYSLSIQHGPGGAKAILKRALAGKDLNKMSTEDILKAIYTERSKVTKDGTLYYFKSSSEKMQEGIKKRFGEELDDLVTLSRSEAGKTPVEAGSRAVVDSEKAQAEVNAQLADQNRQAMTAALAAKTQTEKTTSNVMAGGIGAGAGGRLNEPPTDIADAQTALWILTQNIV